MVFVYLKQSKKYSIKGKNATFIQAPCCGGLEAALVDKSVISDPGGLGHGYQGKLHEYCAVRLCLKMFFIQ